MNYNPFALEGKTILITGASSGIGRATAIECSKMGAKCVITGRNEDRLRETISTMSGDDHMFIKCELSSTSDLEMLVSQMPPIDGMVSNAGTNIMSPISFLKEDDIQEVFKINTIAPMLLLRMLIRGKKLLKGSSVVFTSSLAGLGIAAVGNGIYTASKGAISAFVKVAALELSARNIRVNAVCPGMTKTPMIFDEKVQKEQLEIDMVRYPLKRYAEPNEIAWGIIYLLSNASSWVTGTNLIIDGGLSIV